MGGTPPYVSAVSKVAMDEFLSSDYANVDRALIQRCMKINGKRLYISGATGFFGKNILALLAYLYNNGASFLVTALSRSPERFLLDQTWCRDQPWLEWQQGDVRHPWPGLGHYDLLLHSATDTAANMHRNGLKMFEEMVAGAKNLFEFATNHGVTRILLSGSGAQYGTIPEIHYNGLPESSALACDSTTPVSAYGEGKRACEMLGALYAERHGLEVINTRCFAFVGPGLAMDGHFAIGNFINSAIAGKSIKLSSQGNATRSYLYSADLAVWLLIALLEEKNGAKINVGSDYHLSIYELAMRVRDLLNPKASIHKGNLVSEEDRHHYVPCIAYAKSIGLNVWTNLDRAITRTAHWNRVCE